MAAAVVAKYVEEKDRRIRPEGNAQYVELGAAPSRLLRRLADDPWVDHDALNARPPVLGHGDDVRLLVVGAGYGGLLFAVRLLEAGLAADDVRIVDAAGGFGGTWYWNRYPGIMCDIESYIYMPLLEETGYVPRHRFAYGPELRRHAESIARRWHLADKAAFRTRARALRWDDAARRWHVALTLSRGPGEPAVDMTVRAQFVVLAGGVLNHAKAPRVPGLERFAGPVMHTACWDYAVSGGSPDDWALSRLAGKRVGVVGTGATAVQCVPELARWAARVVVLQRTPSAVDERGQRETDPEAWRALTARPGWWRARNDNWSAVLCRAPVAEDLVHDAWSTIDTFKYLVGGPLPPVADDVTAVVKEALAADAPRMERLRRRVDDVIARDPATAAALKPWYPSWCKRPCFHDDYLAAFNQPHVTLVDTDARGIDAVTARGVVAAGAEHELDVLVLATGYRAVSVDMGEPSSRAKATITGRDGTSLAHKWLVHGPSTVHGLLTHSFPNLLLTGPSQAGMSPNWVFVQDTLARHAAYVVAEALRRAADPARATVEATAQGEADWTAEVAAGAAVRAPMGVCGPSYFNDEGAMARLPPEEMAKLIRGSIYPQGILEYGAVLERWRSEGSMQGVVVT